MEFNDQWIKINRVKLNISKTKYILFQSRSLHNSLPSFSIEGETLTSVCQTKFFVQIDENLNWSFQINKVFSKLPRMCGILYRIRDNLTTEALLNICYTLCYPHNMVYCVLVRPANKQTNRDSTFSNLRFNS